ncbi:hypothetical protein K7I13_03985 [Brucepastera parasyntrophica]|uniref:hypothetical protein n=1 Tax=Brucepastera parasyntrophica TaxID=2880008 RepID=UPI0021099568|nr:hypothetical protein [Brucepastera parasyntrophica]ULQ60477.1 hypothetical protein K7I13_03985 [Brucepastera parasyntrophica]
MNGSGRAFRSEGSAGEFPALYDTGKGFSVSYKNRFLYSKYDPSKSILSAIHDLSLKPETLFLCISPVLGYGLEELLSNLPPDSFVLAIEHDSALFSFEEQLIPPDILAHPSFRLVYAQTIARLLAEMESYNAKVFRRCVRIDFSGGASLFPDFYGQIVAAVDEYISRIWKNRITLINLGRNYARNFFRNSALLPYTFRFPEKQSAKPVLVAGAGPSLDLSISFIKKTGRIFFCSRLIPRFFQCRTRVSGRMRLL